MRIVVCCKLTPNPDRILEEDWAQFDPEETYGYAGTDWGCFDQAALEQGLQLKEAAAQQGQTAECIALTVADHVPAGLAQQLYAAGYAQVICLQTSRREFCPRWVGRQLAEKVKALGADLVLTGAQASHAETGLVPFWLADALDWPIIPDAEAVSLSAEGLTVQYRKPEGLVQRRLPLPAGISVGSSPLVLRCATLRARMQCRGRQAELCPVTEEPPEDKPVLHRPDTGRACQQLDGKAAAAQENLLAVIRAAMHPEGQAVQREAGQTIRFPSVLWAEPCATGPTQESALLAAYDASHPALTLLPDTPEGRRLAVDLATQRQLPCLSHMEILACDAQQVTLSKRVCSANLEWACTLQLPAVLTVPPQSKPDIPAESCRVLPGWQDTEPEVLLAPTQITGLDKAKLVLVCGCGIGSKEACDKVRRLAHALGAGFGLTRPAALNLWGTPAEIVGQSGRILAPDCCIVLGAAGAGAFAVGVEHAKTVIAVNTDPEALVFRHADYGLQMDAAAFADWLREKLTV